MKSLNLTADWMSRLSNNSVASYTLYCVCWSLVESCRPEFVMVWPDSVRGRFLFLLIQLVISFMNLLTKRRALSLFQFKLVDWSQFHALKKHSPKHQSLYYSTGAVSCRKLSCMRTTTHFTPQSSSRRSSDLTDLWTRKWNAKPLFPGERCILDRFRKRTQNIILISNAITWRKLAVYFFLNMPVSVLMAGFSGKPDGKLCCINSNENVQPLGDLFSF